MGIRGRLIDCGELMRCVATRCVALEFGVRAAPFRPHLVREAQRVLQPLEALAQRREREAQALRLVDVPGRTDPEPGPTAGQDVERGRGLHPQARRAVVDAPDHEADARPLGVGGNEAERGLALEHRRLGRAAAANLEEVVHDPDRVEADVVGSARHARQRRTDGGRAAGPGEVVDLEPEPHA